MKSSIKISNNGNTIRATGAAANALFNALANPKPDKAVTEKPWERRPWVIHEHIRGVSYTVGPESAVEGVTGIAGASAGQYVAAIAKDSPECAALIVKAVNNFSRMEQMLKDCLCVMNASAVGLKTQEAVERLLKEINE